MNKTKIQTEMDEGKEGTRMYVWMHGCMEKGCMDNLQEKCQKQHMKRNMVLAEESLLES